MKKMIIIALILSLATAYAGTGHDISRTKNYQKLSHKTVNEKFLKKCNRYRSEKKIKEPYLEKPARSADKENVNPILGTIFVMALLHIYHK